MGTMTSHVVWKNNPNVPNHQPVGIGPAEIQNKNFVRRSTHHATVPMIFFWELLYWDLIREDNSL